MDVKAETIRRQVRGRYANAAKTGSGCGCGSSCCTADYSNEELARIPVESVLGLGSGNPVRHGELRSGDIVVDLGSGGGIDVFLAASQVGPTGKVIGIDMTPEMIARARAASTQSGASNVEFRQGMIEDLPLPTSSADVVLSNCVINLSPDKPAVFREAFRIRSLGYRPGASARRGEGRLRLRRDGDGPRGLHGHDLRGRFHGPRDCRGPAVAHGARGARCVCDHDQGSETRAGGGRVIPSEECCGGSPCCGACCGSKSKAG